MSHRRGDGKPVLRTFKFKLRRRDPVKTEDGGQRYNYLVSVNGLAKAETDTIAEALDVVRAGPRGEWGIMWTGPIRETVWLFCDTRVSSRWSVTTNLEAAGI